MGKLRPSPTSSAGTSLFPTGQGRPPTRSERWSKAKEPLSYTWADGDGFPFDAGDRWHVPSVAYVQKESDATLTVAATHPVILSLPSEAVDPSQLGFTPGKVDMWRLPAAQTQTWKSLSYDIPTDGMLLIVLDPVQEGGGYVRLRLR